eukprot:6548333-Prymnesium_polylepis.1
MRAAVGELYWARVLRASENDLETSTEALRRMYEVGVGVGRRLRVVVDIVARPAHAGTRG